MKTLAFSLLALAALPSLAQAADGDQRWYRHAGEYLATRSTRMGVPTEVSTKILTDGKRFDVSVGKRIPVYTWAEEGPATAWSVGIDGGMLASLERYSRAGNFTFATNTFDGFFGAYVGFVRDGWVVMFRTAHLSAHLVDNSPRILNPVGYSQFWNEVVVGKTYPEPEETSDWEIHAQGSVGFNNSSMPANKQPRAAAGLSFGHSLSGPDSLAVLASADALRAGVLGQSPSYSFFLGLGTLNRPNTTVRPYRVGLAHFRGSDFRNQLFFARQNWTTLEISAEF